MEKLRLYLNSLSPPMQEAFAAELETSVGYLRKAISKGTKLDPRLCVRIEEISKRAVSRQDLIEDWASVWPELLKRVA